MNFPVMEFSSNDLITVRGADMSMIKGFFRMMSVLEAHFHPLSDGNGQRGTIFRGFPGPERQKDFKHG